jgi:RNA polymerase sigma factor (sigma-70 family)
MWMQETGDIELLRQYAREGSEDAFEALVARHLNLVYSAALRKTGSPDAAEEIAQAVFIILARKAGRLPDRTILSGWLYQTARLTASTFLRSEIRRTRREQEAYMQPPSNESEAQTWLQIAPLLEDAMGQLNNEDRTAVVLRFFENKSFAEVGAAFGASENAAKKRVARALDKLRKCFVRHGVVSTSAIIATGISTFSIQQSPAALAKFVTAAAIARGATATASTSTLIKGALKIMAWTKTKTALAVCGALLLAGGATTVAIKMTIHRTPDFKALEASGDFWATSFPTGMPPKTDFKPELSSFPATGNPTICSISGLLDQCMDTTGTKYLIDKYAAAGSVVFGNTNTMDGLQWVAQFEKALETRTPEWWDFSRGKGFRRKENLVLIRFPTQKIVLVVPREKAAKFE